MAECGDHGSLSPVTPWQKSTISRKTLALVILKLFQMTKLLNKYFDISNEIKTVKSSTHLPSNAQH